MKGRKLLEISLALVMIFSITLTENIQLAHAAPPTFTADHTTTTTTVVTFSEVVDGTWQLVDWTVGGVTVTGILDSNGAIETETAVDAASVTLTHPAIPTDSTLNVNYISGDLSDNGNANQMADGTNDDADDGIAPAFVSAATSSATQIDVTFTEAMADAGATPGDFVIAGTLTNSPTVTAITVAGSDLQLTLDATIVNGDVVTVAFTNTGTAPTDTATSPNNLADFTAQTVTNNVAAIPTPTEKKGGGGCSGDCTNPTLGVNDQGRRLVDNGFSYNGNPVNVEHFFTPYPLITVDVGVPNLAEFKIYDNSGADKVWHFELAFGLGKGESIDKNQAMIIWDKSWDGIETTELDDPDNVLDKVRVTTSEVLCQEDSNQMCLLVKVHHIFRAPLEFNILGTNVWDAKRNAMQNYYNHGIEVEGESMNPSLTKEIPGTYRNEGLVTISQSELYSNLWAAEDGRVFELFGPNDSFKLTNPDVQRHEDTGVMKDRYHSSFNGWKEFQAELATSMFDSSVIQGMDPTFFAYDFPEVDTRTQFLLDKGMMAFARG